MKWFLLALGIGLGTYASIFRLGNDRVDRVFSQFEDTPFKFPSQFFWGTASSDQQVEGQQASDWTAFEKRVVKEGLTDEASGRSLLPKAGHIARLDNYSNDVREKKTNYDSLAMEYLSDAKSLGTNAYRFSISWSRLFPREGMTKPDPDGVEYYRNIFETLKSLKMEPFVTLFHFATPEWFWNERNGKRGWEREDALELFGQFVQACLDHYGRYVSYWVTLNEPMVYLYEGYHLGYYPPLEKRKEPDEYAPVVSQLLKAHLKAYKLIKAFEKENDHETWVGIAKHSRTFEPMRRFNPLDRISAKIAEQAFHYDFLDALATGKLHVSGSSFNESIPDLAGSQDYLGVNYYGRLFFQSKLNDPYNPDVYEYDPNDPTQDVDEMKHVMSPHGFYRVLTALNDKYHLPIFVLEHGIAEAAFNDTLRQKYIPAHIKEMGYAMRHGGVDVRGYFYWSLMDNFEWIHGFELKFGLMQVDFDNEFERRFRPSAEIYRKIIKDGRLLGKEE
ncbi:MAG: glycoside hydrolase family 1 protein [Deltaproteobacteria bacterium]|nr:glycoside hydrolase family 1 protein [Deltaproteobacteria bacterium]